MSVQRRRPLILGYHAVSSTWGANLAVPEERLRGQLAYLAARGHVGLTLSEAERRRRDATLPLRSVVVTFDDGYASTMRAAPILEEFGFPGTVFIVTSFVESGEALSWPGIEHWSTPDTVEELRPLSWAQAGELVARGWEVGSHTVTHPLLTTVDDRRLRAELSESRSTIERRLGRCSALAYPYGLADSRVALESQRAGYEVACMLTFAQFIDEPLRRARTGMNGEDSGIRLVTKVSMLGQAARRSRAARLVRILRRRRNWLPAPGPPSAT
jgi:peptidoglycan/xylan/chitin deacetylase (PgdA/CDA1 family)